MMGNPHRRSLNIFTDGSSRFIMAGTMEFFLTGVLVMGSDFGIFNQAPYRLFCR